MTRKKKVLEILDDDWAPFDLDAWLKERNGEYSVILRVRSVPTRKRRHSKPSPKKGRR